MNQNEINMVSSWLLGFGTLPTKNDLHDQKEKTHFLPVGAHSYPIPKDEKLAPILTEWVSNPRKPIDKAIYLNDHYAIAPTGMDNENIYLVATYRM